MTDSLATTDLQRIMEESVDRFVREQQPLHARDAQAYVRLDSLALWPSYAELGLLALPFHESVGGLGGRLDDVTVVSAALGRGLALEPYIEMAIVAGTILQELGWPTGKAAATHIIEGSLRAVVADGRPQFRGGVEYATVSDGFTLSGRVPVVPFARQATEWLLIAVSDRSAQPAVFRLPAQPICLSAPYLTVDKRPAADLVFEQLRVDRRSLIADGAAAVPALEAAARLASAAYCSEAVGIMQSLLRLTAEYLGTRVQFGAKISTFQALQHRFADLHMAYLESFALVKACDSAMREQPPAQQIRHLLAIQIIVGSAAARIGHECIQMHGAIGATADHPVSQLNSRLVAINSYLKGPDAALARLAQLS